MNFNSYAIKVCVSKDENIILTTKAGEIGLSKSIKSAWHKADLQIEKEYLKPTLDQANFFNRDTGFVSGFIHDDNWKYNLIYHTTDGGLKWKAINFGQDGWVDDAIHLDNGEAWLSVAGSGIAYTKDYGFSWEKLRIPEIKQRFSSIFFNVNRQGVIGSLWNLLAYTEDNCKNWKLIPTPLDQKAYNKTNQQSRPEIKRVAMFGEYLLIKQEDLVFFSRKDQISWVWLKEYDDFYTDPQNSSLFFKTVKGSFIRSDYDLNAIYTFENSIQEYDSKCRNGSLFVAGNYAMYQLKPDNNIISVLYNTNQSFTIDPAYIGYSKSGIIGTMKNKAYLQKNYDGKWEYLFDFPFPTHNGRLSVVRNDLILYDTNYDSLYYFNLEGELADKKSKTTMLKEFCERDIKKLIFSEGSQGCFHRFSDELTYTNQHGSFSSPFEQSSGSKHRTTLPDYDDEIDVTTVAEFVKKIPLIFDTTHFATVNELEFTDEEYARCKKDILDFKSTISSNKKKKGSKFYFSKNNLEFDRLLSLVDSIKSLDSRRLNNVLFNLSEIWSTTTNWKQVELINSNNEIITIQSSFYMSNAFCFPWTVSLNGYRVNTTNIEINRFLTKAYPAFLPSDDRISILHMLVKNLY